MSLPARIVFAHATLQRLAQQHGIAILHVKGPAVDADLRSRDRASTDADVLIPVSQVDDYLSAMRRHGWEVLDTFASGSPFGHSVTARHATWGFADVHRHLPGTEDPVRTFAKFMDHAQLVHLAGAPCLALDRVDQTLTILLHAARSGQVGEDKSRAAEDVRTAWTALSVAERETVQRRATELGAQLPFGLALRDDVSAFVDRREYDLWLVSAYGGTRTQEWAARIKAAPTSTQRVALAASMVLVNRHHLEARLGRRATRREMATEFRRRAKAGLQEIVGALRERRKRHVDPE